MRSVKCEVENRTPVSQNACTHGLGWSTAHASSIDEKGHIYISLRQLPPRLVRVLLVSIDDYLWNFMDMWAICRGLPRKNMDKHGGLSHVALFRMGWGGCAGQNEHQIG